MVWSLGEGANTLSASHLIIRLSLYYIHPDCGNDLLLNFVLDKKKFFFSMISVGVR